MPLAKRAALQNQRLEILNCLADDGRDGDAAEIRRGLSESPRRLPCKYFYDALGSRLFEEICLLPEYISPVPKSPFFAREAPAIMAFFAEDDGDFVELGSGSNQKIKLLLDEAGNSFLGQVRYLPVDISASALLESARELVYLYDDLPILGIIADFTRHLEVLPPGRKLITFLGSTIGNFSDQERIAFLQNIASRMNSQDRFLLGLDMVKPVALIEAAYNDSRGVTAAFNKNILSHLNQAWDGDFNLDDFAHVARFNQFQGEGGDVSAGHSPGLGPAGGSRSVLVCQPGEVILTETCQKFTPAKVGRDLRTAGLMVDQWFTDSRNWFSLVLLKKGKLDVKTYSVIPPKNLTRCLHRFHRKSCNWRNNMKAVWKGAVLAESDATIVVEGNHYFPPESIHREYLEPSPPIPPAPGKGWPAIIPLTSSGEVNPDAAWYYPEPKDAAKNIKNYVAFWKNVEIHLL